MGLNFEQFVWEEKSFDFTVGDVETEGTDATAEVKAAVASTVQKFILDWKTTLQAQNSRTEDNIVNQEKLPMDAVLPMALLYYGTQLAESVEFQTPFVQLGVSLEHFNLLNAK